MTAPLVRCVVCGESLPCTGMRKGNRFWRGSPAQLNPLRQWIAENMPSAKDGFVALDRDLVLRTYASRWKTDGIGRCSQIEVKTHDAQTYCSPAIKMAMQSEYERGSKASYLVLGMDGDVPTPLQHWPSACVSCNEPPLPQPSTRIMLMDVITGVKGQLLPDQLKVFLEHIGMGGTLKEWNDKDDDDAFLDDVSHEQHTHVFEVD